MNTTTKEALFPEKDALDTGRIIQPLLGDLLDGAEPKVAADRRVEISVVCPCYNEGEILETAVRAIDRPPIVYQYKNGWFSESWDRARG